MPGTESTAAHPDAATSSVRTHCHGRLGVVQLNRPGSINALTHEMVTAIQCVLDHWATDARIETVVLTGAGDRGLCAGGDIVAMYHDARAGGTDSQRFWADEYRLNATIAEYPKPFVAVMDGIVLGGGIGLSAHARVRVVTERSSVGMPETGIGFLPDVGGTYLLSRTPGEIGTHLALTAGSVRAGDAIAIGLADWFVPTDRLPALLTALATEEPEAAVAAHAGPAPESTLLAMRSWIDEHYAGDDPEAIVAALAAAAEPEARDAATAIAAKSPTSVAVTLAALRRAREMTGLREALDQELRLAVRLHRGHDFTEGVRAQVIDKDRRPRWQPATLAEVGDVEPYFASLGADELGLSGQSAVPR